MYIEVPKHEHKDSVSSDRAGVAATAACARTDSGDAQSPQAAQTNAPSENQHSRTT